MHCVLLGKSTSSPTMRINVCQVSRSAFWVYSDQLARLYLFLFLFFFPMALVCWEVFPVKCLGFGSRAVDDNQSLYAFTDLLYTRVLFTYLLSLHSLTVLTLRDELVHGPSTTAQTESTMAELILRRDGARRSIHLECAGTGFINAWSILQCNFPISRHVANPMKMHFDSTGYSVISSVRYIFQ